MKRGKFITLYGVNTIGKTTHAKRLVRNLRVSGLKAKYVKYPIYSLRPTGIFLNRVLRSSAPLSIPKKSHSPMSEEELQLWFALNRYQFESKLKQMLDQGIYVVAEDYCGTGIAWGISKGSNKKWLESINNYLMKEDIALFLSGKPCLESREKSHIHEQSDALMRKAEVVFESLADEYGWNRIKVCSTPDETEQLIWQLIKNLVT
ncbi:hypothetical protein HYV57_02300 [Candidatus Peregrinibacteria bacterium]|nr:hypothetical protein [Candidatus Peregrinibacteria bacterium]